MNNVYLQHLLLENYRNFQKIEINSDNGHVLLIGQNGSGKTNILEAISLLFPGRGIRNAKFDEICRVGTNSWFIHTKLQSKVGIVEVNSHFQSDTQKRYVEFNGTKIPNNELGKLSTILWLTPQMEGIFLASGSNRRKFWDRIVYSFKHNHASIINQYEHYMYERSQILQQEGVSSSWLKIIEEKMAELSVTIAENRVNILNHIQTTINELETQFPKAILKIEGVTENYISIATENIKELIKDELFTRRNKDKLSGTTTFGVHRSDLSVIHKIKNMPAKFCSTGEQKAMLITLVLAQIISIIKITNNSPIMLLDEIFVHLDDDRKQYLIDFFIQTKLQTWITSTELTGIEKLLGYAKVIKLD